LPTFESTAKGEGSSESGELGHATLTGGETAPCTAQVFYQHCCTTTH